LRRWDFSAHGSYPPAGRFTAKSAPKIACEIVNI
jgi:hypothetical protein